MAAPLFIVSIRDDYLKLENKLNRIEREQLPFAASQSANRLARIAVSTLRFEMQAVFDRPTRFTLNAFYARTGTKDNPQGQVLARDFAGKGTPGWKYLTPEVFGGSRNLKRFERALGYRISDNEFTVPGRGAPLDQYGNIPQGKINQILSGLGAAETHGGFQANRTTRSARRGRSKKPQFFLAHSKRDGRPLGIYKIVGSGKVEPVIVFAHNAPHYHIRLRHHDVVAKAVDENKAKVLEEELNLAVRTAHT